MSTEKKTDKKLNLTVCFTNRRYVKHGYPIRLTAERKEKIEERTDEVYQPLCSLGGQSCLHDPNAKGEGSEGGILMVSEGA